MPYIDPMIQQEPLDVVGIWREREKERESEGEIFLLANIGYMNVMGPKIRV